MKFVDASLTFRDAAKLGLIHRLKLDVGIIFADEIDLRGEQLAPSWITPEFLCDIRLAISFRKDRIGNRRYASARRSRIIRRRIKFVGVP